MAAEVAQAATVRPPHGPTDGYGGDDFADAGLTLTTDRVLGDRADAGPGEGDQTTTERSVDEGVADVALPATGAPAWIVLALGMLLLAARLRGATRAG